jgi:ATP-dependent DNA helicase RecQ
MLRGVDDERTRRFGFTALSTFGLLRGKDEDWVLAVLRALLAAGWIDLTPTDHPVPFLTEHGADVMRGTGPVRFVLPTEELWRTAAPRPRPAKPDLGALDVEARKRFERLREHRAEIARAKGIPPYVIAHDRTLLEMAVRSPQSHAELLQVFGMGPARIDSYGDGFLEVLRT